MKENLKNVKPIDCNLCEVIMSKEKMTELEAYYVLENTNITGVLYEISLKGEISFLKSNMYYYLFVPVEAKDVIVNERKLTACGYGILAEEERINPSIIYCSPKDEKVPIIIFEIEIVSKIMIPNKYYYMYAPAHIGTIHEGTKEIMF